MSLPSTPLVRESQAYERGGTQKDVYAPDEVVAVACPLCGGDDKTPIYSEHGAVGIVRCRSCALIYTSPRVLSPERVYWGNADRYYEEARLIFEDRAPHHRDPNYLEELKLIERYKRHGRFLDVGCNMGMLLRLARKRGWQAVGLEPSPALWKLATTHNGLHAHNCFLHELPHSEHASFDVVALSDVFEHICDPKAFLKDAAPFLADDGVLFVKVPNARWNLFKQRVLGAMGRRPTQGVWDSYEHVVHYTDATLRRMLEESGFEVLTMTIGLPVQIPVWHEYVGHYYQYPSPWFMDWKRYLWRAVFYWLSWPERWVRLGSIGVFAPNIIAIAKRR